MRFRLTVVPLIAAVAVVGALAAVPPASAAPAPPASSAPQGSAAATAVPSAVPRVVTPGHDEGVACLVIDANGMGDDCFNVSVDGSFAAGQVIHAAGSIGQAQSPVVRVQIDRVIVAAGALTAAATGPVSPGTRGPVSAALTARSRFVRSCAVRYKTVLEYSARMTNGQVLRGHFTGPWFDTNYGPCAGALVVAQKRTTHCFVHEAGGGVSACLPQKVALVRSNDTTRLYARGSLSVSYDGGFDQIARIQVDGVRILRNGKAVIGSNGGMNSGPLAPQNAPAIEVQTWPNVPLTLNCSTKYQAEMLYSVRYTDGHLYRGTWSTPVASACLTR